MRIIIDDQGAWVIEFANAFKVLWLEEGSAQIGDGGNVASALFVERSAFRALLVEEAGDGIGESLDGVAGDRAHAFGEGFSLALQFGRRFGAGSVRGEFLAGCTDSLKDGRRLHEDGRHRAMGVGRHQRPVDPLGVGGEAWDPDFDDFLSIRAGFSGSRGRGRNGSAEFLQLVMGRGEFGFDRFPSVAHGVALTLERGDLVLQGSALDAEVIFETPLFLALASDPAMGSRGDAESLSVLGQEASARKDVDLLLLRDDLCLEIEVLTTEILEFGASGDEFDGPFVGTDWGFRAEFTFDRAECDGAGVVEVEIGDRLSVNAGEIGRSKIVETIMAICGDQFRVVGGNRPIDDLDGIIGTATDRDAFPGENMGDLAFAIGEFNAKARHGLRRGKSC